MNCYSCPTVYLYIALVKSRLESDETHNFLTDVRNYVDCAHPVAFSNICQKCAERRKVGVHVPIEETIAHIWRTTEELALSRGMNPFGRR